MSTAVDILNGSVSSYVVIFSTCEFFRESITEISVQMDGYVNRWINNECALLLVALLGSRKHDQTFQKQRLFGLYF